MFDLENVAVSETMPRGTYQAFVSKGEFKTSKSGAEYLEVVFTTVNGRNVFHSFNVLHPNEQPRNIALADMKKMLLASGFTPSSMKFDTKEKLLETVLAVRCNILVDIREDEGYSPRNVVKGYKKLEEEAVGFSDTAPF